MKLIEIRGYNSLAALNVYSALLVGVMMLPMYRGQSYEAFLESMHEMTDADREVIFRRACEFVPVGRDELIGTLSFVCDPNGAPYSQASINNLTPFQLIDAIVAVCMKISEIDPTRLLSKAEKKN